MAPPLDKTKVVGKYFCGRSEGSAFQKQSLTRNLFEVLLYQARSIDYQDDRSQLSKAAIQILLLLKLLLFQSDHIRFLFACFVPHNFPSHQIDALEENKKELELHVSELRNKVKIDCRRYATHLATSSWKKRVSAPTLRAP